MKFNKETDYAIRMTLYCAKHHYKILSAIEIVQECKIPENLGKTILSKLTSNEILKSIKGKNGGFRYNHPEKSISLFSVIEKFEGLEINTCIEKKESCVYRHGECVVCEKMGILKNIIIEQLKNIFIEDLVKEQHQKYNN
ncbi:RrF2 family transcriptional regulator [Cetobacterium sp.]|uniref:RrF2 family transcriptional regulator n=1 Tax=Cetobacterium sp. TaxID=2071632 RepID=UPI003EE746D0